MGKSTSLAFGKITCTLTPTNSSLAAISFKADTILNEDEILSAITPARPLGERKMSGDGETSDVIENWASNGTRDLTIRDTAIADKITQYALTRPRVHFNMDFSYKRDTADDSDVIIQQHFDCFIEEPPAREINTTVFSRKFKINFGKYQEVDGQGNIHG